MYIYRIATIDKDGVITYHGAYKTVEDVVSQIKYMETINPDSILMMIRQKSDKSDKKTPTD